MPRPPALFAVQRSTPTDSHEIRIFVPFPRTTTALTLKSDDWSWFHLLTIPVSTLNEYRYSTRSYKWIRSVTGIIIGTVGVLSPEGGDSPSPRPCDYDWSGNLPEQTLDFYYHTSDQEKRRMLPLTQTMFART